MSKLFYVPSRQGSTLKGKNLLQLNKVFPLKETSFRRVIISADNISKFLFFPENRI